MLAEMPGDFENIVRALLNSVVSLDHLDENDLRVVADSLIDSLSRLCQGVDLHPFVTQQCIVGSRRAVWMQRKWLMLYCSMTG